MRLYPTFLICFFLDTLITVRFVRSFSPVEIVENLTMLPWLLRAPQVTGVFWTLSNEWCFYFMIAAVLPLIRRFQGEIIAFWLVFTTFLERFHLIGIQAEILLNSLYAPFFAAGMLINLYQTSKINPRVAGGFVALTIGTFIGNIEQLIVFATAASIVFSATRIRIPNYLAGIAVRGGAISYALYLISSPIFILVFFTLAPLHANMFVIVVASTILSLATAQAIDRRIQMSVRAALKTLQARPRRSAVQQ